MAMRIKIALIGSLVGILIVTAAAIWWLAYPHSYSDCILAYTKASMTPAATTAIRTSCRAKFPQYTRELSQEEGSRITGRGGLSSHNRFSGTLYNGNRGVAVTEVTITVDNGNGKLVLCP